MLDQRRLRAACASAQCSESLLSPWRNFAAFAMQNMPTVLSTSLGKTFFCLAFYFKWKYFVLIDHILSETICLSCFCVLFSNIYPQIKFMTKNWSDLCNFYSKAIFQNFCLRKYFLLFFAEFELLIFHNNTVKISEKKIEQAKLVENLPPSYLPNRFLHNLHPFLLWEKLKIFEFFLKPMTRIKLFVHR